MLLKEATKANHLQCAIDFVIYLWECIQGLHLQDMSLPHAHPIPESYNPALLYTPWQSTSKYT